jgi:1,4-alpha-glucan branching enzyme
MNERCRNLEFSQDTKILCPGKKEVPSLSQIQEIFPSWRRDLSADAKANGAYIRSAFQTQNSWTQMLEAVTTDDDINHVYQQAKIINPEKADEILAAFYTNLIQGLQEMPDSTYELYTELAEDWIDSPIYYAYVQYTGTPDKKTEGTFETLTGHLDVVKKLGFERLYLLPFYQSPGGDGGYDVSDFRAGDALGGKPAFQKFMARARELNIVVMTDFPANHTSCLLSG